MRPSGTYDMSYAQDMAIVRTKAQWLMLAVFLVFLAVLPQFSGAYWLSRFSFIGIILIAVFGLHLTTGLCGQVNMSQSAFMAVGAYTSALMTDKLGVPFLVALVCAAIMAGVVGLLFGAPSLRIKGLYLCMATIAAQLIIVFVLTRMEFLTGGSMGTRAPFASIGGIVFDTDIKMYYLIAGMTLLMGVFAKNIARTRTGRAFVAIRDDDVAAEVMGVNIFYYKLLAFFLGCSYAGIAGSLWAHYMSFISPEQFSLKDSVWYLGMLVVGGGTSTMGAVFGTAFIKFLDMASDHIAPVLSSTFTFLPANITFVISVIFFGIVVIVFLIFEPRGMVHWWSTFKASYHLWPYSHDV